MTEETAGREEHAARIGIGIGVGLRLIQIEGSFAVCKLDRSAPIPRWAIDGDFFSISRTADELSVVCRQEVVPEGGGLASERDWRCLRVAGAMPFTLVGVLAAITAPIAEAGVGVFAFSTYDTDYLLVKAVDSRRAVAALQQAGLVVESLEPADREETP